MDIIEHLKRKGLVHVARNCSEELELLPSGYERLDSLCSGGLAKGRISEIMTGPWGASSVIYSLLARATAGNGAAAVVDLGQGFDAVSAACAGVSLDRLLWVTPRGIKEAYQASDLLLATNGFVAMVLDLSSREIESTNAAWMRLDRLARGSNTVVLVLSRSGLVGPFAHVSLQVRRCRPVWRRAGDGKSSNAPFCLAGIDLDFVLHRRRSA